MENKILNEGQKCTFNYDRNVTVSDRYKKRDGTTIVIASKIMDNLFYWCSYGGNGLMLAMKHELTPIL